MRKHINELTPQQINKHCRADGYAYVNETTLEGTQRYRIIRARMRNAEMRVLVLGTGKWRAPLTNATVDFE